MTLPLCIHPAIMFKLVLSSFISLSCETSWLSLGRRQSFRSLMRRPAEVSGVSGPYMAIYGRPARLHASLMALISAKVAFTSNGVLETAGIPLMVASTPLTMVSTKASCA